MFRLGGLRENGFPGDMREDWVLFILNGLILVSGW